MENNLVIEGRNAVLEALKNNSTIDKILVQNGSNEGSIKKIVYEARQKKIVIQTVEKERLDKLSVTNRHQGVVAFIAAYDYVEVDDILKVAQERNEDPFIIVLDNISDPHNLGAIIRSANIAGAHGIIIPKRRSVGLTAVVAKTSAGAIEYTKVARVSNIARTLEDLKKHNIWIACADMDGDIMYNVDLKGPMCIVIGSEGEGVGKLVKQKCDFVTSIPMKGEISSLNASVAAGLLMFEVVRQRMS